MDDDKEEVLRSGSRDRAPVAPSTEWPVMASRPKHAFGVPMGTLLKLSKRLGTNHELSLALWESGWYEARLLAALVGDPGGSRAAQMDAWAAGFENWGDCDTVCFKLFDRTPFAWEKVAPLGGLAARVRQARRLCAAVAVSRCMTSTRPTRGLPRGFASSSAPPPTNGTSSRSR